MLDMILLGLQVLVLVASAVGCAVVWHRARALGDAKAALIAGRPDGPARRALRRLLWVWYGPEPEHDAQDELPWEELPRADRGAIERELFTELMSEARARGGRQ